jgi:hypothetical protein
MQVTKHIDTTINQDVTFTVTIGDIRKCYANAPTEEGIDAAIKAIGKIPEMIEAIPDFLIDQMTPKHHQIVREYLTKVIARFQK